MSWIDDEFLHLIKRTILHNIVDSPWPVTYFEISAISDILGECCELGIEIHLIRLALNSLDHIRRVVCLGSESIDDTNSLLFQENCLRDLRGKPVSSLREDDF